LQNGPFAMALDTGAATSGYHTINLDTVTESIADGTYNLSVNATDAAGNTKISANVSVLIENTAANVSNVEPANGTTFTGETFLINASVNDTLSKVFNASFMLINETDETTWYYATLGTGDIDQGYWNVSIDSSTITDGLYNITINATDFAGNQRLVNISRITINNAAANVGPTVGNVTNGTVTLIDGGIAEFTVTFNATDADGNSDLDDTEAGVNVSFNGVKIGNNTGNCATTDIGSDGRQYSCIISFHYYLNSSPIWQINVTAGDGTVLVYNDSQTADPLNSSSHNITINSLSAFQLQVNSTHKTGNSPNTNNIELTFVINNTGNFDFITLNITPYALNASLTDFFMLFHNFSINATPSTTGLGIFSEGNGAIKLTNNNITTTGTNDNYGILYSHNNNLTTSNISTKGATHAYGINLTTSPPPPTRAPPYAYQAATPPT